MSTNEQSKTNNRIFVTGYSTKDKNEDDIKAMFTKYGEISEFSWKGRFCFIAYSKAEEASEAVSEMNQKELEGNTFIVEIARAKKKDGECYQCGKIGHLQFIHGNPLVPAIVDKKEDPQAQAQDVIKRRAKNTGNEVHPAHPVLHLLHPPEIGRRSLKEQKEKNPHHQVIEFKRIYR